MANYNRVKLDESHEAFIVQGIACGLSYRDIADKMIALFNGFDSSHRAQLVTKIARVATSTKFRDFIRDSREAWEKECLDVPIAVRKIRLQRLENEYHRLEKQSVEKVIVTPSNQEIIVYRQNTDKMLKLLQAAKSEIFELTQPTKDAPQGKRDDKLEVTMRGDAMFNPDDAPEV